MEQEQIEEAAENEAQPSESGPLVLSARDFDQFMHSLDNPKPPSAALIEARKAYRKMQREHPEANW